MTNFLRKLDQTRLAKREALREETREKLRASLHELIPNSEVFVYGSITAPFRFHAKSDIDLAILKDPGGAAIYRLQSQIEEQLGRPVDLVLLNESRLREKILASGERWIV
jgi:predicted nucleotidyltransferase